MSSASRKKWGQNFLRNPRAARRIVDALAPEPDDLVLEIGPGEGALTRELLHLPNDIVVVEIDPRLVESLRKEFGDRLQIVHGDATEIALPSRPFRAVGNLPYNVATPIIRRVLMSSSWRRAVFMVQKEVADRFTAAAGHEAYGYLTLLTKLYATTKRLMTLEPGSFHPRPKVRSAVVIFEPAEANTRGRREGIAELLSAGFRMRRKKLLNNLEGYRSLTRRDAEQAIERAGLDSGIRAEQMSLQDFDRLAVRVEQSGVAQRTAPRESRR